MQRNPIRNACKNTGPGYVVYEISLYRTSGSCRVYNLHSACRLHQRRNAPAVESGKYCGAAAGRRIKELCRIHLRGSNRFEKLKIWEYAEYRSLQGTYPVIFLSFSRVKGSSYPYTQIMINQILAEIYEKTDICWMAESLLIMIKEIANDWIHNSSSNVSLIILTPLKLVIHHEVYEILRSQRYPFFQRFQKYLIPDHGMPRFYP